MSDDSETRKPILVLDFDGVLHSYDSGWKGANVIPDAPVPGAVDFCHEAAKHFDVRIVSSRCKLAGGSAAIESWLEANGFPADELLVSRDGAKPAAFVTIDDRAITFDGEWPDVARLLEFRPWNKK